MQGFRRSVVSAVILGVLASCVVAQPAMAFCCDNASRRAQERYLRHRPRRPKPIAKAPTSTATPQTSSDCNSVIVKPGDDVAAVMERHPAGTTFCFQAGTHRLRRPLEPQTGDVLAGAPGSVVSGARVVENWTSADGRWVADVPGLEATETDWSGSSLLYPQAVYEQDLFLAGTTLTKVGVRDEGSVVGKDLTSVGPGRYFVDYDADRIYLGSDPSGKTAELSLTSGGIDSSADKVSVTGMTIEKFAGRGIESAGGEGWNITGNEIRFNHTLALKVYGDGYVARNFIHHNGQYGLSGTGSNNVFEGNEVAFNNAARFARSEDSFWDAGGSKFVHNTNLTLKDNYVHDNFGDGLWVDIKNTDVKVIGNRVERNSRIGINYEISFAGTIESNVIINNGYVGIWVNTSRDVTVTGNRVERNYHSIVVVDQDRDDYFTANVLVSNNTIVDSGVTGTRDTTAAKFVNNTYKVDDLDEEFWEWDSEDVDAAEWKALGMDLKGIFSLL